MGKLKGITEMFTDSEIETMLEAGLLKEETRPVSVFYTYTKDGSPTMRAKKAKLKSEAISRNIKVGQARARAKGVVIGRVSPQLVDEPYRTGYVDQWFEDGGKSVRLLASQLSKDSKKRIGMSCVQRLIKEGRERWIAGGSKLDETELAAQEQDKARMAARKDGKLVAKAEGVRWDQPSPNLIAEPYRSEIVDQWLREGDNRVRLFGDPIRHLSSRLSTKGSASPVNMGCTVNLINEGRERLVAQEKDIQAVLQID